MITQAEFGLAVILFLSGALLSSHRKATYILAFAASVLVLLLGVAGFTSNGTFWQYTLLPGISLRLGLDRLSGIFMVMAAVVWIALALYSLDYSRLYPHKSLSAGFNISLLGMLWILTARDGFTLMIGWEVMTVAAFVMMLASGKYYQQSFRFLAFGEFSFIFLLIGFAAMYISSGSISFEHIQRGGMLFMVFVSLGFIIKMDIVPFHGWMSGIYGEIPDTAAAVLSAPVTLMGVYGLERIIPAIPNSEAWSLVLIVLGAISAFWGGLQAVAANKVRLLPAYSTIENNGMILTAIGFYTISKGSIDPSLHYLSLFAQAASLVLALSHTLSKTLLFMSLGHAKEAYNVHTIDEARGVWSGVGKTPALGIVIAALSFSAFPPLIGFVGEWMILETIFQSYKFPGAATAFFAAISGVLTAMAIGLISFAMIKLIGYTALGYDHGRKSQPMAKTWMRITETSLQLLIIACGIGLPAVILFFGYAELLSGLLGVPKPLALVSGQPLFGIISPTFIAIIMLILIIIPILVFIANRKAVRKVHSWNGGIPLDEQEFFTAQAYSQILEHILRKVYRTREVSLGMHRRIEVEDILLRPIRSFTKLVQKLGEGEALVIMNGKISAYVTYILILFVLAFVIGVIVM